MLVWQVVMPPRRLEPMTMRNVREGVSRKRDGEVWHGDEFAGRIQTIHLTIYLALYAKGKSDSYGALVD